LDTEKDKNTERTPFKDKGQVHGNMLISQGMTEISGKPLEAKGEAWNRLSLSPQKESTLSVP
jgi:hypothetical protein